jgi:hypothetical protein
MAARPPRAAPAKPRKPLAEACRERAAWLRKRLDRTFRLVVDPPFVVAGNLGRGYVRQYHRRGVLRPARALYASYIEKRPDRPITILLMKNERTYRRVARELFRDTNVAYYGYYTPHNRTMLMNIGPGIGTLYHELTHALVAFDFPDIPDWFNEGLGSLHEGAYATRTRMVGVTNWRLPILQDALFKKRLRSLRDLLTKNDFYSYQSGQNYAQARFFCQFMQQRRVLARLYRYFRGHAKVQSASVKAVEHVFGRSLDRVEREFLAWVRRLRYRRS